MILKLQRIVLILFISIPVGLHDPEEVVVGLLVHLTALTEAAALAELAHLLHVRHLLLLLELAAITLGLHFEVPYSVHWFCQLYFWIFYTQLKFELIFTCCFDPVQLLNKEARDSQPRQQRGSFLAGQTHNGTKQVFEIHATTSLSN